VRIEGRAELRARNFRKESAKRRKLQTDLFLIRRFSCVFLARVDSRNENSVAITGENAAR